jgi:hypothetical protein
VWKPLFLGFLLIAGTANAEPSWSFVVHVPGENGAATVQWTLNGFSGRTHLCADKDGGGRYFTPPRTAGGATAEPDRNSRDCWWIDAPAGAPLTLTYKVDLPAIAEEESDPDWAMRAGGGFVVTDEAILLRPDPLPEDAQLQAKFDLPAGWSVSAPWDKLPDGGFQTTSEQFDGASYLAIGPQASLGALPVKGGAFNLVLLGSLGHASPEKVREWVRRGGAAMADFYGGLPAPQVEVILVAEPGNSQAGLFGTVFHPEHPSVVLLFCPDASDKDFQDDWIPTHELFHIGNPSLSHRVPWFTEGVATYYQDVLRGRTHNQEPVAMWGDMYDGFRRYCDPSWWVPLQVESREMSRRHGYQRVYWGGACLMFRADAAIREHSHGKRSLDDVVRNALLRSREDDLDEEQLITMIDQAAGRPIARETLTTKKALPMKELYQQLGIEPTGPDTVRLHDDAPLAWVRKGIFQ